MGTRHTVKTVKEEGKGVEGELPGQWAAQKMPPVRMPRYDP